MVLHFRDVLQPRDVISQNISNPKSHFDIESGIGNSTIASIKNRQGYE